ncbi:glycosyltransferase family 4 protein [Enterovibrio norvegicus]|uniref:Glycosyl transferase family 1 domain-containing protein n=1 Tax=Enterovibrio norvegicus TaxID=188144 RepID=A0A2N7LDQ2_9GAMM|nr:glycosyltransferase family 4 protein [Enterovibrio norvegicus]PML75583.1 hypothetical protein BCT69_06390 [Enterovibrio norvegicus]PMN93495.1 hypothetical protein BCT23_12615 [Enterovibrio norvegicus]
MNILIFINDILNEEKIEFSIGGIQTYIRELCHVINGDGIDNALILQYSKEEFSINIDGIKVIGTGVTTVSKVKSFITKNFKAKDTLLIFATDKHSFRIKNFKSINIQHGIAYDVEAFEGRRRIFSSPFLSPIYKFLQRSNARKLASHGNHLVCVDYNYFNWIKTYGSWHGDRITVIPNFSKVPCELNNNSSRDRKVLIARRFVERRGIGLICKAISDYYEQGGELEFVFAGEGPDKGIIDNLKNQYPSRISITKFHPNDSLKFHSNFQFALIPSLGSEGTTLSLLEAMSSGCITIATHVGGITNIVIDGFNGIMVTPRTKDILETLWKAEKLSKEECYRMSMNASNTIKYSFSNHRWGNDWLDLVDRVKNISY